jgi:hypothetical protein
MLIASQGFVGNILKMMGVIMTGSQKVPGMVV